VKKKLIWIGVVLVCIFAAILPFLIKVKIDCKSQYGACPDEINAKLSGEAGSGSARQMSLFQAKRNASKILKNDFLVSDFSIQFKIPNILQTQIIVKNPEVAFKNTGNGSMILVDKDGKALSNASDSALPVVTVDDNLPGIGKDISNEDLFALNLTNGVYQMYPIGQSQVQDGSLLVELPGQIRVIFPLGGDAQVLLGSLRLIYSKIQSDGNPNGYSQIDLRFKNPVLR